MNITGHLCPVNFFYFQSFTNIYGITPSLYSDNTITFKLGDILLEFLSSDVFSEHMRINIIKYYKIPLYSIWVESVWERMIRKVNVYIN